MIIDLAKFIQSEQPFWSELEAFLKKVADDPARAWSLDESKRFHYLYQRASSDLAKVAASAFEPETERYLQALVSRAYGELHQHTGDSRQWKPLDWFFHVFPQTFRRHAQAFWLSCAITLAGAAFGALALTFDPESKQTLLPFDHLQGSPTERVAAEEQANRDRLAGHKTSFSAMLMTHNTKIAVLTMALGMTWGVGAIVVLFFNGIVLGAVCIDYIAAGQSLFLAGWLLPHGSVEIPAILIAGQAGLTLARTLIGSGERLSLRMRLRRRRHDILTLIGGVAILLMWAGVVEAFFSQYHEPILPYEIKILFGMTELLLLTVFLSRSGRARQEAGKHSLLERRAQ